MPGVDDRDPIPLEDPGPPAPPGRPCPSCGRRLAPGGVHCSACGFNLVRGWGPVPGVSSSTEPTACRKCGYDLVGNTSGVCPECGDRRHAPKPLPSSRAKPATCRTCGYDLAGIAPDVCPECGHRVPKGRAAALMPTAAEAMREAYIRVAIGAGLAVVALPLAYHPANDLVRALIATVAAAPVAFILFYLFSMAWDGFDTPLPLAGAQVLAVTALLVAAAGLLHLTAGAPALLMGITYRSVAMRGLIYTIVAVVAVHGVMEEDLEDAWVGALPLGFVAAVAVPASLWLWP
jgi:hypothetical protein